MSGPYTKLDMEQVIKRSFDEPNDRLRVDAEVTATIGSVDVIIDAASGDNIKISDGVHDLKINPDGSIDANTNVRASTGDSVIAVGTEDGTESGTQHALKVDSNKDLHTTDTQVLAKLNTGVNTLIGNTFVKVAYDEFNVLSKDLDGNLTSIQYKNAGSQVALLTLTYDSDGDIQSVKVT